MKINTNNNSLIATSGWYVRGETWDRSIWDGRNVWRLIRQTDGFWEAKQMRF